MSRRGRGPHRADTRPKGLGSAQTLGLQAAQDRLEHLRQVEALLGTALGRIFFAGFGDTLHWPAQIQRFDGSHVAVSEAAMDAAAELVANVAKPLRKEICEILKQPLESVTRTYHVCDPVPREQWEPQDESHKSEAPRRRKTTGKPTANVGDVANRIGKVTHAASCR